MGGGRGQKRVKTRHPLEPTHTSAPVHRSVQERVAGGRLGRERGAAQACDSPLYPHHTRLPQHQASLPAPLGQRLKLSTPAGIKSWKKHQREPAAACRDSLSLLRAGSGVRVACGCWSGAWCGLLPGRAMPAPPAERADRLTDGLAQPSAGQRCPAPALPPHEGLPPPSGPSTALPGKE